MNSQLPDLAQRQLDALRAAVDVRLSALEAALADPARAGSLEALVLDLARVATEEAQAAASKACVDTKLEVDTQMARAMATAQASIQQERTVGAELRRVIEQARQQITALENEKQTEVRNLRTSLEAQVARESEAAKGLERLRADAQSQLEAERRRVEELQRTAENARKTAAAALAQEKARGLELEQSLAGLKRLLETARGEVTQGHEKAGGLERTLADTQSKLEMERRTAAELRRAIEDAKGLSNALTQEKKRGVELEQSLAGLKRHLEAARAEVTQGHEKAGGLEAALADTHSQLEAERRVTAELRRTAEEAEQLSAALAQEKTQGLELGQSLAGFKQHVEEARAETAHERERVGSLERSLADTQSQLEAERRATATLQRAVEEAGERSAALAQEKTQSLEQTLAETQSQLEFERTSSSELRLAADRVAERLATIGPEISRILEAHDAISKELAAERDKRAHLQRAHDETRAELDAAHTRLEVLESGPLRSRVMVPRSAAATAPVSPEGWATVRLAERFSFRKPIDIQINSEPGLLFDISVAGCQLVSLSTLRPNQILKIALPFGDAPIGCTGKVMWARLETSGFRAGIQFKKPDEQAIEAFVAERAAV